MNDLISELKKDFTHLAMKIQEYGMAHDYSITTYLENFSASLLSLVFGGSFVNANYFKMNTSGYDVIDINANAICQVTIEHVNKCKITRSLDKVVNVAGYNKIYFLFLTYEDKKEYVLKCPIPFEVITLKSLFLKCESNPKLANKVKNLFNIWIKDSVDFDLFEKFNGFFYNVIENNSISRKYIKDIYIEEDDLKINLRAFSSNYFKNLWLKTNLSFINNCKVSKELKIWGYDQGIKFSVNNEIDKQEYSKIKDKIIEMIELSKNLYNRDLLVQNNKKLSEVTNKFMWGNSSLQFELKDINNKLEIFNKKFLMIVKDAGQGKTNLLCDFVDTFINTHKIPYIFININDITDNIYEYIERRCLELIGTPLVRTFEFINNYCSSCDTNLIIILDGINECHNAHNFNNSLKELLSLINTYSNLKVIMTCRTTSYHQQFSDFEKKKPFNDSLLAIIENDNKKSEIFKRRIIERYFKFFNICISMSDEVKSKLANDTLLLRMFCEVYKDINSQHIDTINNYLIYKKYLSLRSESLVKQGFIQTDEEFFILLNKIVNQMLNSNNYLNFTIEDFNGEERRLLNQIVDADIIIKKERKNIIRSTYIYSFVFDEIRDFLIAQNIAELELEPAQKILDRIDLNTYDGIGRYVLIFSKILKNSSLSDYISKMDNIYYNTIFEIDDRYVTENDVDRITSKFDDDIFHNNLNNCHFFSHKLIYRCDKIKFKILNISILTEKLKQSQFLIDALSTHNEYDNKFEGILIDFINQKNQYMSSNEHEYILEFLLEIAPKSYMIYEKFQNLINVIYKADKQLFHNLLDGHINKHMIEGMLC